MSSWFRSQDMTYASLIISEEAAPACIRELGILGCFQFTDLNPELTPFQRRYVSYVKRCDEIERKIRYIQGEAQKMNITPESNGTVESFIHNTAGPEYASGAFILETLESKLDKFEHELLDLNKYSDKLATEYQQKVEFHHLLVKAQKFLAAGNSLQSQELELSRSTTGGVEDTGIALSPLMSGGRATAEERGYQNNEEMAFSNIAGVLPSADKARFERMLFRATRGNCYVRFSTLGPKAVDSTGQYISKICFIIFYKSESIESKIKRICDAFSANRYNLSNLNRPQELDVQKHNNYREMLDSKTILDKMTEKKGSLCTEACKNLEEWLRIVKREKGIYHSLNLFKDDVASNLLRGRAWVLTEKMNKAQSALKRAHMSLNIPNTSMLERVPEGWPTPPTAFPLSKYTVAFQLFVNTYGVPRYKVANPALFTAATFPFFFGVMYGDIGHGSCLALAGLFLILSATPSNLASISGMMKGIYVARYMIFAMGVMSVYAGLVYNDYFSLGLDLFGTRWNYAVKETGEKAIFASTYGDEKAVYPFGVDPAWHISSNDLLFFNSMKMKMSVILGITHMTFGIILKGMDAVYFKNWLDFYCEFVPCIIFDVAFFGYMIILIFVKWSIDWQERMALGTCGYDTAGVLGACKLSDDVSTCYNAVGTACTAASTLAEVCTLDFGGTGDGCQPPNLITTLINIALKPGNVEEPMYTGQAGVQTFILLLAFICVPWLLFIKPFYLKFTHKASEVPAHAGGHAEASNPLLSGADVSDHGTSNPHGSATAGHGGGGGGDHGHGEEFNFGEIFIHQAIETIEFVLGMVSNTASYLRLWALSLAHSELARVFWEKAMLSMIETGNPVLIFMGYAVFAVVTFMVLLSMDVLECFLHALRLHWVEFQNKFYKSDGYSFQPFDFKKLLDDSAGDD